MILVIHLNYLMIYVFGLNYPNLEDSKFSQRPGIGILVDHSQHTEFPSNIWRFYLLYTRPEAQVIKLLLNSLINALVHYQL